MTRWRNENLLRSIAIVFIFFCVVFSLFTLFRILLLYRLLDFGVYYQAVEKIINGCNPYVSSVGEMVFIYPPTALLFLLPLHFFPISIAEDLWTLTSFIAFNLSIYFLLKSVMKKVKVLWFLIIYSFFVLSFPIKFSFGMGQINMFILFLLCLTFYFYTREKDKFSATFLSIAISLKLAPAILLFFFARKKKWKVVTFTLFIIALLHSVVQLLSKQHLLSYYYLKVFPSISLIGNSAYYNQAFTGFLARMNLSDNTSFLLNYLSLIILLIFTYRIINTRRMKPENELIQFGMLIVVMLIAGGLTWQHHLVLLVIPYIGVIVSVFRRLKIYLKHKVFIIFAILLSCFLFSINLKNPFIFSTGALVLVQSHGLYSMLILFGVLWYINSNTILVRNKR